ncbi:MAG TPA: hypothetical protein VF465_21970 [Flavobacterium sp.]|uniref:hypothetical protein n=1 Tax=Flavobacterium sp. TaxID=239 RepID=UPI002ECFF180
MRLNTLTKVLITFLITICTFSLNAAEIWVSPQGKDTNSGTKASPLATVQMAVRKARELRRLKDASIKDGIRIIVMNGTYSLNEPLFIRPEDSGTADSPTTIEADVNAKPILSGGIEIKNWKKSTIAINGLKTGTVWEANAPQQAGEILNYRQLWVNGKKAVRAKNTAGDKWTEFCPGMQQPKPAGFLSKTNQLSLNREWKCTSCNGGQLRISESKILK